MAYGSRRYGNARYSFSASRTFFETFTETVVLNSSLLNQLNLQEGLILSDTSSKTLRSVKSEDVFLQSSADRVADLNRVLLEDAFLQSDSSVSSSLTRVYTEDVVLNDLSSKNIVTSAEEDFYMNENVSKTVSVFRDSDIVLNDVSSKEIVRTVPEELYLDDFSSVALAVEFSEDLYLKESDLDRGSNIVKIFVRDFDEKVYMNDGEYLLSLLRGVGIPEIFTEQLERYNMDLEPQELGIDIDVTGDTEDSGSL
jgi:hypothetical protein